MVFSDVTERHAAERALRAQRGAVPQPGGDLERPGLVDRPRGALDLPQSGGGAAHLRLQGDGPARHADAGAAGARSCASGTRRCSPRVLAGEPVFRHETRHLRRDGSLVDLSFNAVPLRDARGDIVGATGTARDITEERAAAAALHESVEKLRLAVDAAELCYWEWDARQRPAALGPRARPAAAGGGCGGADALVRVPRRRVHPEDRERYVAAGRAAWDAASPCANEYRADPAGRPRALDCRSHGKTLLDAAGRPVRMIGVSQDITERKRREDEDALPRLPRHADRPAQPAPAGRPAAPGGVPRAAARRARRA